MQTYRKKYIKLIVCIFVFLFPVFTESTDIFSLPSSPQPSGLWLATFDVDAPPPNGSFFAYDQMTNTWDLGLRAKSIVISGAGQLIALCAVDCIGSIQADMKTQNTGELFVEFQLPAKKMHPGLFVVMAAYGDSWRRSCTKVRTLLK